MKLFRRLNRQTRLIILGFIVITLIPAALFIAKNPLKVKADSFLKLDEGGGSTTKDTQNNTSGTITNAVWQPEQFCISGKCLFFDGNGDYVSFGDDSDFDFAAATNWTISFWFRHAPKSGGNPEILVSKANASAGYLISLETDGNIAFAIDDDATWTPFPDDYAISTAGNYDDNQWHYIAAVKTGTSKIELFIDGQLVGSDSSLSATGTLANSANFAIGSLSDGSSYPYTGFIDEVNIFTTSARTQAQIKSDAVPGAGAVDVAAAFGSTQTTSVNLSNGLIGYWPMDELSANTCTGGSNDNCDKSGNAKDGAWTGTATTGIGKFGNAVVLDGDSDYVNMGDHTIHDLSVPFSIFTWIKMDQLPGTAGHDYEIINKYNTSGNRQWTFAIGSDNYLYSWFSYNGTNGQYPFAAGHLFTASDVGVWRHVGITADAGGNMKMYYEGQIVQSGNLNNLTIYNGASVNMRLGARGTNANYFDGSIDEARLYNRTLTPAEVKQLYEWSPGPVNHYKFDENTGTTIYDSSGYNNNSTSQSGSPGFAQGKFGSALNVNAGYYQVPNTTSYSNQSAYTFSFWINPTIGSAEVIDKRADSVGWGIGINSNKFQFTVDYSTQDLSCTGPTLGSTQGSWQHVVIAWDGTSNCNGVKLYKNGTLENWLSTQDGTGTRQSDAGANLRIGGNGYTNMTGSLDDLRIYNYARTHAQIITDMNAGHPTPGSPVGSVLGHWKFDEGQGDIARDSGLGGNNADLAGSCPGAGTCPTWTNDGKFDKTLTFDGGDYLTTSETANLTLGKVDFTMSTWVKYTSTTFSTLIGWRRINSSDLTKIQGLFTINRATTDGRLEFETWAWQDAATRLYSINPINDGQWHMATAVYTVSDNTARLYIDGVLNDSKSQGAVYNPDTSTDFGIIMGANATIVQQYTGSLDDVRVYNQALTADQIKVLYNGAVSTQMSSISTDSSGNPSNSAARAYCPPGNTETNCAGSNNPAPAAEWKMNENTGTTLLDTSGNANNSTTWTGNAIYAPSIFSSGLLLDGVDDVIRINPAISSLTNIGGTSDSYSASAWFKTTNTNTGKTMGLVAKKRDNSGAHPFSLSVTSNPKKVGFTLSDGTSTCSDSNPTANPVINDGKWHFAAASWNTSNNRIYLYVDGALVNIASCGISDANSFANAIDISIGNSRGGNYLNDDFDGTIDQVSIFNYHRTPAQIAWQFGHGKPTVGWWKMDENVSGNGQTINDSTIWGKNGTTADSGGAAINCTITGKRNLGCDFDGTNDSINVGNQAIYDAITVDGGDFTVAGWFNRDTFANDHTIIGKRASQANGNPGWLIWIDGTTDKLTFEGCDANATCDEYMIESASTFTTSGWHHFALVWDDDSEASTTLYIDGIAESVTKTGTFSNIGNLEGTSRNLRIGSESGGSSNNFDGKLDDLMIFSHALSKQEILNHYNQSAVSF